MSIETVAARLTEAAFPVAQGHGTVDSWNDLELELWKVLTETLQRMGTDCSELPQRKPTLEADAVSGFFSSDKTFRGKLTCPCRWRLSSRSTARCSSET